MRRKTEGNRPTEFFRSAVDDYDSLHYGERSLMSVRLESVLAVIEELGLKQRSRALDVGCGPGHLVFELSALDLDASGVDTSFPMLALACERIRDSQPGHAPSLQLARVEELPYRNGSFDLVCSTGMIEYLPEDGPALAEFHRIIRPAGHLVLTITNAWSPAGLLDWMVELLKRQKWFLTPFNWLWVRRGNVPVRPREFAIRRHRPAEIRRRLAEAGFETVKSRFFYMLPWPHPFDRLFPSATAALGIKIEKYCAGMLGPLAEGCLVVARKIDS